jgi:hypothetical protein
LFSTTRPPASTKLVWRALESEIVAAMQHMSSGGQIYCHVPRRFGVGLPPQFVPSREARVYNCAVGPNVPPLVRGSGDGVHLTACTPVRQPRRCRSPMTRTALFGALRQSRRLST